MAKKIQIGKFFVGDGESCFVVADAGINHNGDPNIARKLIQAAVLSGCNAIKFQKRTIDVVYTKDELAKPRENPFGTTNGDLKRGLEFSTQQYQEIDRYCREHDILWFASCWDEGSVDVIEQFKPCCYKIASASLTDDNLLRYHRKFKRPIILSTGMSTLKQIDHAVDILGKEDLILLHCTSTYPSKPEELNLSAIPELKKRYGIPVGYSGHEVGLATSVAAVALGACAVERHITLDRAMWGSDQAASVEPHGFARLVRDLRSVEVGLGDGRKRVYDSEMPIMKKLRRVGL
ncbi:MAG: N-acetylneuraminate synthase family protein [Kiritimatiellae bacterium]|nr:N-acetylneuraminate synthase family protein [Kiritimatiellia bacterium]MDD5522689.1 N-acetylneuraminate synthase family protein [Kiritimatiellia bacterium]